MISPNSLDIAWLREVSKKNNKIDLILVEKVIRALLLLEGIALSKSKFIFKGGTSLMLLLNSVRRLSIDIDIVVSSDWDLAINGAFETNLRKSGFNKFELESRISSDKIPKAHYKFYYTPIYSTNLAEDYVLLDVLFEESNYSKVLQCDISSTFVIEVNEPIKVSVPSPDDLLGDKLTAFAPYTTGIPYEKKGISQSMEIIKQLYDIGCLFNIMKSVDIVRQSFLNIAKKEIMYRELSITITDVLEDIFHTALCISTRGFVRKEDFAKLSQGIKSIGSYVFTESYHIEKSIIDASKAAYLAKLIGLNKDKFDIFIDSESVRNWTIESPFETKLNKLKKSNPEAFFYWYKTFQLIGERNAIPENLFAGEM